ncbi:hypothetical protein EZV73_23345 [Acidaminobacter sp. JC074]|uniref:hypothetical protein n=1 Tax=Acidaminobacter sp. JC074 TaxID=2530199 RepID=UPI001F10D026|nr:hypothetical protein [Acidaminobacter sp. JC074]MCH4890536.1 hypothetical protein [Acidaminobacter sp. JC074]
MKKLMLLIIFILLIGCGNNQTMVTYDEKESVEITEDYILTGQFGDEEITCQYKIQGDDIFGKFDFADRQVIFRGEGKHNAFRVRAEEDELLIYIEDDTLLGVRVEDLTPIYVGNKKPEITEDTLAMMGVYEQYDNTYYVGHKVIIEPLFEHLILINKVFYENGKESSEYELGIKTESAYYLPLSDAYLMINERYELVIDYDGQSQVYSETKRVSSPSLRDLKIASDEEEARLIQALLGDYYDELVNIAYDISLSDHEVKISNLARIRKDRHLYVWLHKDLTGASDHLIITNDLDGPPIDMRGQVQIMPLLENGFKTELSGSKDDLVPFDYQIIQQDENDHLEALLIENDHKILMVLEKGSDYQVQVLLDLSDLTIDDIRFEEDILVIRISGKDTYYWSDKFYFDTRFDYRLLSSVYERYNPETKATQIITYDFINDDVLIESGNISLNREKKIHESIYLKTFDGFYNKEYK